MAIKSQKKSIIFSPTHQRFWWVGLLVLSSVILFMFFYLVREPDSDVINRQNNNIPINFVENKKNTAKDCVITPEERIVRGTSLSGLIESGETVKILFGFYACNEVKLNDVIIYDYAGSDVPIIKIVRAVPGDKWHLQKNDKNNGYRIIINGEPLKNSKNESYQISESNSKMLKLYTKSYPILPKNTYLILGNQLSGTLDATKFGLIDKSDILGKVIFQ